MKIINIKNESNLPKYQQIIISIERTIRDKILKKGDRLPSINKVCMEFTLSRDTVLLAYKELKRKGIIDSFPGKGYYVKSVDVSHLYNIFVMFDELNVFKEDLYNSIIESFGGKAKVDVFFHHFNFHVFKNLIENSAGNYTTYIIMPANFDDVGDVVGLLPRNQVYILDQTKKGLENYPAVYQNFRKDIFNCLIDGLPLIEKYQKLILVFSSDKQPIGMKSGFKDFCEHFEKDYEIIERFVMRDVKPGEIYITPDDRDLVQIIKKAKSQYLEIGNEIGIISYNDSSLKEVVDNGITTISTDFIKMGQTLANMILNRSKKLVENNCSLIYRNSL